MELKLIPLRKPKNKNHYLIKVNTMEGDADDYHSFTLRASTIEELRELIIGLTLLTLAYPRGRSGLDDYIGKFYEEYISENLYSRSGVNDSITSFKVLYFNDDAEEFSVDYELDDDMIGRINSFDGLTEEEIYKMEFDKTKPLVN